MNNLQKSWAIIKCSMEVLKKNKKLLLFPLINFFLICIITLFFAVPAIQINKHTDISSGFYGAFGQIFFFVSPTENFFQIFPAGYMLIGFLYLVSIFVGTLLNLAFYHEILKALNGENVSLSRGFITASKRIPQVFIWSMFTGFIGFFIKALEERLSIVGNWIMSLIGLAFSVASIFIIPVIIRNEKQLNPIQLLKSSAHILRKTWGESVLGLMSFAAIRIFFVLGIVVIFGVSMYLGVLFIQQFPSIVFILVILSAFIFMCSYILDVGVKIYLAALYIFGSEGVVPMPFEREHMEKAWILKAGKNR